jgi:hypothetical protein
MEQKHPTTNTHLRIYPKISFSNVSPTEMAQRERKEEAYC